MAYKITLILMLISMSCFSNDKDKAIKHIQKAIVNYPEIKRSIRKVEKKVIKHLPIDKKTFGVVGGTVVSVIKGSVNTRVLKNINFNVYGANCRPDIEYRFNGVVNTAISLKWEF